MKEQEEAKIKMSSVSRRALLERPRLDEQLVLSLHYRITLIHAPHGYGKSTAVGQFLTTHQFSHAYMQSTAEDNHAKTFASGLNRMLISLLQHVEESDDQLIFRSAIKSVQNNEFYGGKGTGLLAYNPLL